MESYYRILTAKAPVNIALIKYWGKKDETLKIPINDSLSGTLNTDEMCATTSVALSETFESNEFWLNNQKQNFSDGTNTKILLDEIKRLSTLDKKILNYKVHIVSHNNFPTAAGLASSAAGYACLAYVLGHLYGVIDSTQLSRIARRGSGSACRSLFGGFVQWVKGDGNETSQASQIVDHKYWPKMKVIICVVNDTQKDISSSDGMARTVQTSELIHHRADSIVPQRIEKIKEAILKKDFETFAKITMQDSNQFHSLCLDTYPPLFYLNDTSRQIIKICTLVNSIYKCNKVAYTFDAGPNACIYLLEEFVPQFVMIAKRFFPKLGKKENLEELEVLGKPVPVCENQSEAETICHTLMSSSVSTTPNALSYLIYTSIGDGPRLVDEHQKDKNLEA